jgi:hypothetical protein
MLGQFKVYYTLTYYGQDNHSMPDSSLVGVDPLHMSLALATVVSPSCASSTGYSLQNREIMHLSV